MIGLFGHAQAAATVYTELGNFSTVGEYISALLAWANPIIGSLAIIMFIVAGYMYMTSQGNPDQIKHAKEIVMGVVLGLALLFLASLLFNTIGVNLNPGTVPAPGSGGAAGGAAAGGGAAGGGGGGAGGGGAE